MSLSKQTNKSIKMRHLKALIAFEISIVYALHICYKKYYDIDNNDCYTLVGREC